MFAHRRKAVLDLGDIEGVHAMRVASRRLRAALEVFGPCLPRKRGARALADVKALAGALGERRDRDVQTRAARPACTRAARPPSAARSSC